MHPFYVSPADATTALRALKTVALANGTFAEGERALLGAAARLYGARDDIGALRPIAAADLAQSVAAYDQRLRLFQACLLMALADGDPSPEESRVLEEFRGALEVDDAHLEIARAAALDRRRAAEAQLSRCAGERHAASGAVRFLRRLSGRGDEDAAVAWRYRKLGLLPEGTLGRELWRFSRERELPFPGEIGGPSEADLRHDIVHVISGYGTDPVGELYTGAFIAGMTREDAFAHLFFPMLALTGGPGGEPSWTEAELIRALERGAASKDDLTAGFDLWSSAAEPLGELRRRLAVT